MGAHRRADWNGDVMNRRTFLSALPALAIAPVPEDVAPKVYRAEDVRLFFGGRELTPFVVRGAGGALPIGAEFLRASVDAKLAELRALDLGTFTLPEHVRITGTIK